MASNTLKTLSVVAFASILGACASAPKNAPVAEAAPAAPAPVVAAPVVEAPAPAAPAASTSGLKITPTPEGFIAIHYHRTAKDYAPVDFAKCDFAQCWGVHAWGDAYNSDTSWFKPVFPVGTDDFGAVFHIKANEDKEIAATADANYIIHKGDTKDQGGKDMSFDHNKSKRIFVVQDDGKVYFTLEDALKSPNYK